MKPSLMLFPLVIAVVIIAIFFINPQIPAPAQQIPIQNTTTFNTCQGSAACFSSWVTKIVDGDTLDVENTLLDINSTRIRLALTNTPERGQPGWAEATAFTKQMCPVGSMVHIDEDDGQIEGSYGRMIAKVTCGEKVVNAELLSAGHAVISTNFCNESEFATENWAQQFGCSLT